MIDPDRDVDDVDARRSRELHLLSAAAGAAARHELSMLHRSILERYGLTVTDPFDGRRAGVDPNVHGTLLEERRRRIDAGDDHDDDDDDDDAGAAPYQGWVLDIGLEPDAEGRGLGIDFAVSVDGTLREFDGDGLPGGIVDLTALRRQLETLRLAATIPVEAVLTVIESIRAPGELR